MPTRYFKKASANVSLMLTNGSYLKFPPSAGDQYWGYLAVENAYLLEEIDAAMRNGVGGITEITKEEYADRNEKKKGWMGLSPLLNQMLVKEGIKYPSPSLSPRVEPGVAAEGDKPLEGESILAPAGVVSNFRPKAVRM